MKKLILLVLVLVLLLAITVPVFAGGDNAPGYGGGGSVTDGPPGWSQVNPGQGGSDNPGPGGD